MGILEIILFGIGLSADAVSVTLSNCFANKNLSKSKQLAMPLLFGLFQGLMPLIGYFAGSLAASFIERFAGIISLVILGGIGAKMIWDAFHEDGDDDASDKLTYKVLLVQAIATSIDAFAVGVSFCAEGANIWLAAPVIAACTFLCCLLVLLVGKRLGDILGKSAEVIGGIILILIGLKAMFF